MTSTRDPITGRYTYPSAANAHLRAVLAARERQPHTSDPDLIPQPVMTDAAALAAEVRDLNALLRAALYGQDDPNDAEEATE